MENFYTGVRSEFGFLLWSDVKIPKYRILKSFSCNHSNIETQSWSEGGGIMSTDYNVDICNDCGKIVSVFKWNGQKRKIRFGRMKAS